MPRVFDDHYTHDHITQDVYPCPRTARDRSFARAKASSSSRSRRRKFRQCFPRRGDEKYNRSSRPDRSLSHGAMLAVAALWVCAFGLMFTLMSREVKGLRQVVRQKVRGVRGRPRIGRSLRVSDFLAFPRLSTGRPTPRLRRDGIRGTSARGRVATRVRGRVTGTLGGETRDLPRRRKETRVVAHFTFREVHGRCDTKNNLARSLFTRRHRPRPSPRS